MVKKQTNQLRSGAILSYVNLALSSLIPFFYTPVMLEILGKSEYGLYSLSSSAISYLSLLSFGFGGTILRYLSMYRARGEKEKEEEAFGFFVLLYVGVAVLILIGGAIIAQNVEAIFHKGLTVSELDKMKILVMLMTLSSAVSFPISVFSSVVMAHEKYIFRKLVDMLSTVLVPLSNLVVLYLGYGSVGMAVVSVCIQLSMLPINGWYCIKVLHVRPRFAKMPWGLIREMLSFSAFVFIGTIVDMLFWSTDKILLGMYTSTAIVAVYNIGCTFNNMVLNLSTSISGVLTPRITAMVTTDTKTEQLTELFIRVGRLQYIIVALIISGFTVFGQSFIELWAGKSYAAAYWIAIVTMFSLCIPLIQNTGLSIVTAQNKHQFRAIVYLIIAIANVVATYFCIPRWGGFGAAACSGVAYLLGQGVVMNLYYWKVTGLNIPLFWKNIFQMSVVPAMMIVAGLVLKKHFLWNQWKNFFVGVIVFTAVYGILMYCFSMNEYEKDIFKTLLRRVYLSSKWLRGILKKK